MNGLRDVAHLLLIIFKRATIQAGHGATLPISNPTCVTQPQLAQQTQQSYCMFPTKHPGIKRQASQIDETGILTPNK